jgi:hypothetical protein
MSATIHVEKRHSLGLEEAKKRGHELLARFHEKLSNLISDVSWNSDGTQGTASGKIFSATFFVTDSQVSVDVELKGLGARVMKGQIQAQIEKSLDRRFS